MKNSSRLEIVPITLKEANAYVDQHHRHHGPVVGHKFSIIFDRKDSGGDAEVHLSTVGQFTGLLDKNGERIFEGDVLTVDGEDGFFALEFQEDTARFVMYGDSIVVDFDNFWSYEVEVIGNIHDGGFGYD